MCFWFRGPQYIHTCLLVGLVIDEEPVASFNRSVIWIPPSGRSVETGTVGAVKAGKGKIKKVETLGRVTVALEDHLWIVEHWAEDVLKEHAGINFEDVVKGVQERMNLNSPPTEGKTVDLIVYSGDIVNRTENNVFVYKKPSSFP
jgi:hypothetical protein